MLFFPELSQVFDSKTSPFVVNNCLSLLSFSYIEEDVEYLIHAVLLAPTLIKLLGNQEESFATAFQINLKTNKYTLCSPLEAISNQLKNPDAYFQGLKEEYNTIKEEYLNGTHLYSELISTSFQYANQVEFVPDELLYDANQTPMKFIGSLFLGNILMSLESSIDFYFSKETHTVKLQYRMG